MRTAARPGCARAAITRAVPARTAGRSGQPRPGQPDPRRARPEPGGLRVARLPPAGRDRARPGFADAENGGELIQLDAVHLGGEQQPGDVPAGAGLPPAAGGAAVPSARITRLITSCAARMRPFPAAGRAHRAAGAPLPRECWCWRRPWGTMSFVPGSMLTGSRAPAGDEVVGEDASHPLAGRSRDRTWRAAGSLRAPGAEPAYRVGRGRGARHGRNPALGRAARVAGLFAHGTQLAGPGRSRRRDNVGAGGLEPGSGSRSPRRPARAVTPCAIAARRRSARSPRSSPPTATYWSPKAGCAPR